MNTKMAGWLGAVLGLAMVAGTAQAQQQKSGDPPVQRSGQPAQKSPLHSKPGSTQPPPAPPPVQLETRELDGDLAKNAGARINYNIHGQTPCLVHAKWINQGSGSRDRGMLLGIDCSSKPFGGRASPEVYLNFSLKSGWKIKSVNIVDQAPSDNNSGWQWANKPAVGSNNPYSKMSVHANANGRTYVVVQVMIEGPAGTDPYQ